MKATDQSTAIAVFVLFVTFALGGLHYWVWTRLVRNTSLSAPWQSGYSTALVVLCILTIVGVSSPMFIARSTAKPLAFVAYIWVGFIFLTSSALLALELVALAERILIRTAIPEPGRRLAVARALAFAAAAAGVVGSSLAVRGGLRQPILKRVRVELARLPSAFHGLKVVQLTDVHIGPTIGRDFLQSVVERVNALSPDLVVITGDLIDGSVEELAEHIAPLASLSAPEGVFFVTGNHEYYFGADAWVEHLRGLRIQVLRNESVVLERDGARVFVVGVTDYSAHSFGDASDFDKAMANCADAMTLLLAHQPKHFKEAARRGVDLQLSGHTHGGQLFPFDLLVKLAEPYPLGLYLEKGSQLYVSAGTGYWGPPMRLGTEAEITELTLHSSSRVEQA